MLSKLNRENVIWKMRCEQTFEGGEGAALEKKDSTERARRKPEGFQNCAWYNINSKEARMTALEGKVA